MQQSANILQENTKREIMADLQILEGMLLSFLQRIEPAAWQRRMRPHQAEWTLHETVAHLVAAAEFYISALRHTLRHEILVAPTFQQRQNLPAYNQQEIMLRQHLQPSQLITALQEALSQTHELAKQLTPEQISWPVQIPVFNRLPTILEVLETQITHPGLVHAAQIASPACMNPLWQEFEVDFMHRMLTRFFHLMALIYWPERGGRVDTTLQFVVDGAAGGEWYVSISPAGCQSGEGRVSDLRMTTIRAVNVDALCQIITRKMSIGQALLRKKIDVRGNLFLAGRLLFLFSPT